MYVLEPYIVNTQSNRLYIKVYLREDIPVYFF